MLRAEMKKLSNMQEQMDNVSRYSNSKDKSEENVRNEKQCNRNEGCVWMGSSIDWTQVMKEGTWKYV